MSGNHTMTEYEMSGNYTMMEYKMSGNHTVTEYEMSGNNTVTKYEMSVEPYSQKSGWIKHSNERTFQVITIK